MSNLLRGGFRVLNAEGARSTRRTVASGFSLQNSCPGIAPGEMVKAVSDGTVIIAEAGDTTLLGVVKSVSYVGTDGRRIYNAMLPAGYTYAGGAHIMNPLAPIIEVWEGPGLVYEGCMDASVADVLTRFQQGFNTTDLTATSATSVDSVFKTSLRTLNNSVQTGAANVRILEIVQAPDQDYSAQYCRVKFTINEGIDSLNTNASGV